MRILVLPLAVPTTHRTLANANSDMLPGAEPGAIVQKAMVTAGHLLQNRYRIEFLLGPGGMGAVYRAWDTWLDIPVAVKEMVPHRFLSH
ncbi:MAG: hypothetical protein N3B68_06000 [Anaerolineae bacterium]|nr:hypothetical protein [Anaerolineae bacterium]